MQIPIPDVAKSVKRRFFRRSPGARRVRQMQRAEARGLAHAGGIQTSIALVGAVPCVAVLLAAMWGFGYLTLIAIPLVWIVLLLVADATRRNRAPLVSAWRRGRRRRRLKRALRRSGRTR